MSGKIRILAIIIAAVTAFGLTACGTDNGKETSAAATTAATTKEAATTEAPTSADTTEATTTAAASASATTAAANTTAAAATTVADAETTGAAGAEEPSRPSDPAFNHIGLSKYDEPLYVTFARLGDPNVRFAPGQDYTNNIWMTEYKDILGVEIRTVWTAEGSQSYDEKLQMQILAQDLPDVFDCNAAQFISLVNGGMIQDLTDVYDEYATDLLKENALMDGGLGLEQASVNGRLYGIPSGSVGAGAYQFLFIREDWREQVGLPEPKTIADVENLAKAFVEADPDGMNAYGIGISNQPYETYFTVRGFFDSFGAHINQWIKKDGKLEHGVVQPEVKNALTVFNKWYNDGLLDPEFIVKGSYDMSQEAIGGRVGIVAGEWWLTTWPLPDGYRLGQNWKAYYIPFDASNAEKLYSARAQLGGRYVARTGFEHPEVLLKLCNLYQERALSNKYPAEIYRTDGEFHYEGLAVFRPVMGPDRNHITQENITRAIDTNDTSVLDGEDDWSKYQSAIDYINGVGADTPDVFATNFMWWRAYYGPDSIFAMMERMKVENMYTLDEYFDPPTETMAELQGQLQSMAEETINNITMGIDGIDSFDTFVEAWYANGGEQLTAEVNAWYDGR